MRIVGIDASTNRTGMSLFINEEYAGHVLIDLHHIKNTDERIAQMMHEIKAHLYIFKPDLIVMEECLMTTNIKTVKLLSYLAGAIISWAADNKVEFKFQLPSEWRKRIGLAQGPKKKREELKQEAIDLVKKKFGIDATDDESEAILLGYSMFYKEEKAEEIDIEI